MIQGLIVALITYAFIWIYRRFFAKMISEEKWVEQLTVYHDADNYSLKERQQAEQFLLYHEGLLRARGIHYITNEKFVAQKKQKHMHAQKTIGDVLAAGPPGKTVFGVEALGERYRDFGGNAWIASDPICATHAVADSRNDIIYD